MTEGFTNRVGVTLSPKLDGMDECEPLLGAPDAEPIGFAGAGILIGNLLGFGEVRVVAEGLANSFGVG